MINLTSAVFTHETQNSPDPYSLITIKSYQEISIKRPIWLISAQSPAMFSKVIWCDAPRTIQSSGGIAPGVFWGGTSYRRNQIYMKRSYWSKMCLRRLAAFWRKKKRVCAYEKSPFSPQKTSLLTKKRIVTLRRHCGVQNTFLYRSRAKNTLRQALRKPLG